MTVVPCRPAFFRAELLPATPRILRKQAAAVWADVHILIFTDHVVTHGFCPPFTFILRRIEKPTIGKSQKIPEIHGDIFSFLRCFHGLFRSLFSWRGYWKTAENAVFIGIFSGFLLFLIASYSYSPAPGPRFLRKFLKEGPTVSVTLRRGEVGRPPGGRQ